MAKKIKMKEEELDIQTAEKPKKESWVSRWFQMNCKDDISDIKTICELTARSIREQFIINVKSENCEIYAMIFKAVYETILQFLSDKQKMYPAYTIEFGKSINIGYSNSSSTDNEKLGNFMPVMEYLGVNMNIINSADRDDKDATDKNLSSWKQTNVKKTIEHYKEIQELAHARLFTDYHTDMRTSEALIPMFCIFMDNINNVLRMKYREADGTKVSEVSISVLGLFTAYYSFDDVAGKELIEYQPAQFSKLKLKNDNIAGR